MYKIGVFCSACDNINPHYFEEAKRLGEWIGSNGHSLVYGGAALGLMECVARAVKESGGKVIGVVPEKLEEKNKVSSLIDEIYNTVNLSDRKDKMEELSDFMIALPGGVGTLDEIFHVIAAGSIGYHDKKIIFYNIDGFYNKLISVLEDLQKGGFLRHSPEKYYLVANNLDELKSLIKL